jgi:uncharacterized protein YkwD
MRFLTGALLALLAVPMVAQAQPIGGAERVLQLVNAERTAHGCAPLKISDQLTEAAERESRDMATQHFFNHTEPDGTTPGMRVKDTGYVYQMVGENIAADTNDADDAVGDWMNSPGHRANILMCAFRETGIAVYEQDDDAPVSGVPGTYRAYWTQVFAMPLR